MHEDHRRTGIAVQFGVLTTIEMATAVLVYIPVAYLADRSHKKPFVLITFIFFTCFPLVLMLSDHFDGWSWPSSSAASRSSASRPAKP